MTNKQTLAENNRRLTRLYHQKSDWLIAAAYNIAGDRESAKDLVAELYLYLSEKINPKIWYGADDFNMLYLYSFIKSRYINSLKRNAKLRPLSNEWDTKDTEYDTDRDMNIQKVYDEVVSEIDELQKTKLWPAAKLAEIYFFTPDMTLERLSKEIGISKSTSFLNVRKIKQHFRSSKKNPFIDD